jgi:aspartate aminotransferase
MPPSYGGALVDIVLNTPDLKQIWQQEVTDMRVRMQSLRQLLVDELAAQEVRQDFAFITRQKGMFSYLCISPEQVRKVRQDFGVYFVDSSRINVAGISQGNVKYLAQSLAKVL